MSSTHRWIIGVVGACVVCAVVLMWVATLALVSQRSASTKSQKAETEAQPASTPLVNAPPAERLARARSLIAEEDFSGARGELLAIDAAAPEHKEARKLLARVSQLDKAKQKAEKAATEKALITVRQEYAKELERKMLEEFHDMYVRTSGPAHTTITFRYVLMSRPLVYNVINNSDVMARLRILGFKKAVFTDGYDQTWTQEVG